MTAQGTGPALSLLPTTVPLAHFSPQPPTLPSAQPHRCFAVRRRLFLFHHSPSRCTELKEIGLQDVARSLAWAGEGAICVALRRE